MLVDMGRILRQLMLRFPDHAALINLERGRSFSYRQMHDLSNRVSNFLTGRFGLGAGDFYGTILENDNMALFHPWMFKSPVGGAWIDIRESALEQLSQIEHASPKVVFLEKRLLENLYKPLKARGVELVCMDPPGPDWPGVHYYWQLVDESPAAEVRADLHAYDSGRHTAVLRFTGGTTGKAKCAMYSLANLWLWGCNPAHYYETFPYDNPRALFFSPLNHAASGSVVVPALIKGGTVVTWNKADWDAMGKVIEAEKINMIYGVPTVLYRILEMDLPSRHDISSLKTIRYGAASISPAKLEELLAVFGPIFVQGYGSTECWPSATILGRGDHRTDGELWLKRLTSVGRPLPNQEVFIRDFEGNPLPTGETGEIWIRGMNTIQAYFKDPELTRDNFTPEGYWKSGDIGAMDEDGYVYLIDRKKDLIITGGFNVYAAEVENCLNSHPAVRDSAVVGLPHEDWGEAVSAVVVMKDGHKCDPAELIAHCKEKMARHKAPKQIEIVGQLPTSGAGKVLRREVREMLMQIRACDK